MKKILLIALFVTTFGQLHAKEFTAAGVEPFWHVTLKSQGSSNTYHATFSHPAEKGIEYIEGKLSKETSPGQTLFIGKSTGGESFSVLVYQKSCTDYASNYNYPSSVTVRIGDWQFKGCSKDKLLQSQQTKPVSSTRAKAKQLNTQGFRLYKQGKYKQALPLFYRASKTDSRYALAQYNLACTAAIIARSNQCFQDEELSQLLTLDSITAALKQSIMLDPRRKSKSQTDPDLTLVRQTYPYYRDILRYSPDNDRQLRQMLENINWSQAGGFYPHQGKPALILFDSDSVTTINNKGLQRTGRYSLNNGLITLTFTSENYGRQQITGRLLDNDGTFRGVLRFSGAAKANVLPFDEYTAAFTTPNCSEN